MTFDRTHSLSRTKIIGNFKIYPLSNYEIINKAVKGHLMTAERQAIGPNTAQAKEIRSDWMLAQYTVKEQAS